MNRISIWEDDTTKLNFHTCANSDIIKWLNFAIEIWNAYGSNLPWSFQDSSLITTVHIHIPTKSLWSWTVFTYISHQDSCVDSCCHLLVRVYCRFLQIATPLYRLTLHSPLRGSQVQLDSKQWYVISKLLHAMVLAPKSKKFDFTQCSVLDMDASLTRMDCVFQKPYSMLITLLCIP